MRGRNGSGKWGKKGKWVRWCNSRVIRGESVNQLGDTAERERERERERHPAK